MAQTAHNALVESFALHVRSLGAFFHDQPRDDDMWAGDWFAPDEWESIRAAEPLVELRQTRGRVNKEIAHLTYARLDVQSPVWPHQEIVERLSSDIFKFLDRVDPSRVVDGFKICAWSSLPMAHFHPAPIVRGDSSPVRPVATSASASADRNRTQTTVPQRNTNEVLPVPRRVPQPNGNRDAAAGARRLRRSFSQRP